MSARHGVPPRGLMSTKRSPFFEGHFGRMFRALPMAKFGTTDDENIKNLTGLGSAMSADFDPPKDDTDDEESGIPALYTYLGQFIDHDLTFDPESSFQKKKDPDALTDFRTPAFDLDNVYGRGPGDQPYMYLDDGKSFALGDPFTLGDARARDLLRSPAGRALIGDPRNDENVIVSQLQGLFHRFHNKIASDHADWHFSRIQREVRFHYQWVVLHDFLPTIVSEGVLNQVLPHLNMKSNTRVNRPQIEFFHWRNAPFMPLEFSAAAYRFGHSMVRPGYRLSETIGPLAIFETDPNKALTGFREFPNNWAIDWNLFINLEPRDSDDRTRTQLAYKIDTSLVNPLAHLPPSIAINPSI